MGKSFFSSNRPKAFSRRILAATAMLLAAAGVWIAAVETADAGRRGGLRFGGFGVVIQGGPGWGGYGGGYRRYRYLRREREYEPRRQRGYGYRKKKAPAVAAKAYQPKKRRYAGARYRPAKAVAVAAVAAAAASAAAPGEGEAGYLPPGEGAPAPAEVETAALPPGPGGEPSDGVIASAGEIASAQVHLQFMGYDVPEATGVMNLKTKIAIMQFQDSIKAPTTGELTQEQLQTLFAAVEKRSEAKR